MYLLSADLLSVSWPITGFQWTYTLAGRSTPLCTCITPASSAISARIKALWLTGGLHLHIFSWHACIFNLHISLWTFCSAGSRFQNFWFKVWSKVRHLNWQAAGSIWRKRKSSSQVRCTSVCWVFVNVTHFNRWVKRAAVHGVQEIKQRGLFFFFLLF